MRYLFGLACAVAFDAGLAVQLIALEEHGLVTVVETLVIRWVGLASLVEHVGYIVGCYVQGRGIHGLVGEHGGYVILGDGAILSDI